MNICDFIPTGKENAIRRDTLVNMLNLPDRTVRRMIQEARDRGEIILNSQDGAGYYMSHDLGELKRQVKRNNSRAMSVLRQNTHLRRKIKELEVQASGQTSMQFGVGSHG